jgi:hypothetical protein
VYFLELFRSAWEARGWSVAVSEDPRRFVDGDVAIAHIDLTKIPLRWAEVLARYPRVVNGRLPDISKRRVTPALLTDVERWDGPVIVKTNENCAGSADTYERASRLTFGFAPAARVAALLLRAADRASGIDPRQPYPVFDRLADVPQRLRRNRALVVQRFLPERDGARYVLRFATFFGRRAVSTRLLSEEKIVKSGGVVAPPEVVETPPALLDQLEALGADYGKADYVLHDGVPLLLDVNRTPTFLGREPNARHLHMIATLAPGLEEFTGRS